MTTVITLELVPHYEIGELKLGEIIALASCIVLVCAEGQQAC